MKRRGFIKRAGAAASIVPFALGKNQLFAHTFGSPLSQLAAMADQNDRVLVLVQLNGGNDGLNTIVPLDQFDNLRKARKNIIIPQRKLIKFDTSIGLHPSLQRMAEMYGEAKLGIVRGVGYPKPNFSHFRSADIWKTASPAEEVWNTGWLGRYLEKLMPNYPVGYPNADFPHPPAITIGSVVSSTCQGDLLNLGMAVRNPDNFDALSLTGVDEVPDSQYGYELKYLRDMIGQTNSFLEAVKMASEMGANITNLYPRKNRLAQQLRIVARLIAGGLKTKIYVVNMGGYDTHANQTEEDDTTTGRHASLLETLAVATHAFQDDLRLMKLQHRVVGMTFSEFGRRISSNDSMGTDHGAAAPMFFFGTRVRNRIFGTNPVIPDEVSPRDNLPMQYDFRSLYGSVLMDWFGVPEDDIKSLLFPDFEHIPVIQGPNREGGPVFERKVYMKQNYPNPFQNSTKIPIWVKEAGLVKVSVFDGEGRLLDTLMERELEVGNHVIPFDARGYSPGKYFFHVRVKHWHDMKVGIKRP